MRFDHGKSHTDHFTASFLVEFIGVNVYLTVHVYVLPLVVSLNVCFKFNIPKNVNT